MMRLQSVAAFGFGLVLSGCAPNSNLPGKELDVSSLQDLQIATGMHKIVCRRNPTT